jgi:hypothetical protein
MKAPMVGILFRLYIAAEDAIIGAILLQIMEGKEHIICNTHFLHDKFFAKVEVY